MAGSRYEYLLTLNDRMSSVLRRVGIAGGETYNRLNEQQERLNQSASNFGGILSRLAIGAAAFTLGKKIVTAGADIETTRTSFEVLMGSMEKADKMIQDIRNYDIVSPYQAKYLMDNVKMMLAFNVSQEKVLPTMKMLGDIAMGNQEKMNLLTLAYSQVSSAGRLMGQDLLQLINAGFNPLQIISQQTGRSLADLKKDMEKGLISFDMVEAAFKSATSEGGKFYKMAEKQSETVSGKWSTLLGKIDALLTRIGQKTNGTISRILDGLISLVDNVGKIIQPFRDFIGMIQAGNPVFIAFAGTVLFLTTAFAAYSLWTNIITKSTRIWTGVQAVFNAVMYGNPIYLIIGAIIALIAVIGYVIYKTDGWGKMWQHTVKGAQLLWKTFTDYVQAYFGTMVNGIMIGVDKVMAAFYKAKEAAGIGDSAENQRMINKFESDAQARVTAIKTGWKNVGDSAKGAAAEFKAAAQSLTWNKGKKLTDMTAGLKKQLGMDAAVPGTTGGLAAGTGGNSVDSTSKGISEGGSRPTNINITLGNLVETLTITPANMSEGAAELEQKVREALLRVLNSANGVAYGN